MPSNPGCLENRAKCSIVGLEAYKAKNTVRMDLVS